MIRGMFLYFSILKKKRYSKIMLYLKKFPVPWKNVTFRKWVVHFWKTNERIVCIFCFLGLGFAPMPTLDSDLNQSDGKTTSYRSMNWTFFHRIKLRANMYGAPHPMIPLWLRWFLGQLEKRSTRIRAVRLAKRFPWNVWNQDPSHCLVERQFAGYFFHLSLGGSRSNVGRFGVGLVVSKYRNRLYTCT